MNYLVKWPAREVFVLLVYVGPDEFKLGDLHDFVSRASSREYATVIPTAASAIDEARSLHPELFI